MDSRGFDTVARTIACSGSRRGLMRALVGTVTMLALSRRASRVAAQSDPLDPATVRPIPSAWPVARPVITSGRPTTFAVVAMKGAAVPAMRIVAAGWSVRRATFPAPSVPMPVRVPAVTASPAPPAPVTTG